jgi:hypothetical protein
MVGEEFEKGGDSSRRMCIRSIADVLSYLQYFAKKYGEIYHIKAYTRLRGSKLFWCRCGRSKMT